MSTPRIVVCGSRGFDAWPFLHNQLTRLTRKFAKVEISTGGARGADRLAEHWATTIAPGLFGYGNVLLKIFHADWDRHGKAAGFIRNQELADWGTHCVAFRLPGVSNGTDDMVRRARRAGLKVKVFLLEDW